ncbi:MAG: hypothetical protein CVU89_08960 [Firmicutes bacterium HGW-Firmicutes-14]|jgi:uncharacterized C2H2 Zn-finger protein|nr:MAG: hypothetical protein CVU89_08960 [Firmicutes bacterium HGW-Firmicutes-14]
MPVKRGSPENSIIEQGDIMVKVIFFLILAFIWLLVIINYSLKKSIRRNSPKIQPLGSSGDWGTHTCSCGTSRERFKALAMNRPDNRVLLKCPCCSSLWEEQMNLYGNKWRHVDSEYAGDQYGFKESRDDTEDRRRLVETEKIDP